MPAVVIEPAVFVKDAPVAVEFPAEDITPAVETDPEPVSEIFPDDVVVKSEGIVTAPPYTAIGPATEAELLNVISVVVVVRPNVNEAGAALNVVFANQTQDGKGTDAAAPANTKGTLNTLGANYTMGAITAYLFNQTAKDDNATAANKLDRTSNIYGVKYVTGPHSFLAQTGNAKLKSSGQTSTATYQVEGEKSTLTGLGYDYALSKRTNLYGIYGANNLSSAYPVNPALNTNAFALGVRHTF